MAILNVSIATTSKHMGDEDGCPERASCKGHNRTNWKGNRRKEGTLEPVRVMTPLPYLDPRYDNNNNMVILIMAISSTDG